MGDPMGDRRLALGAEGTLSGNWQGLPLFVVNGEFGCPCDMSLHAIWTDVQ